MDARKNEDDHFVERLGIFDQDEFDSRSLGDLDLSRTVANIFLENGPKYIEAIRRALVTEDSSALRQSTHKLKGAAATMALPLLTETAQLLESRAESPDRESKAELFSQLVQQFEEAAEVLQGLFLSPPGSSPR